MDHLSLATSPSPSGWSWMARQRGASG